MKKPDIGQVAVGIMVMLVIIVVVFVILATPVKESTRKLNSVRDNTDTLIEKISYGISRINNQSVVSILVKFDAADETVNTIPDLDKFKPDLIWELKAAEKICDKELPLLKDYPKFSSYSEQLNKCHHYTKLLGVLEGTNK